MRAASMSRPTRSAPASNAGNASGLTPGMLASLIAAVPDPDSEATSASTDLPLADSDAVKSPLPVSPLPCRNWRRSAPASLNCVETSAVPSLFLASSRPVSSPPSSLPLTSASLTPSLAMTASMWASSRTPKYPAAIELNVSSSSPVNGIAAFDWNGTVGQLSPAGCRLASPSTMAATGAASNASRLRLPVRCGSPSFISALTSPDTGPSAISPWMLPTTSSPRAKSTSAVSDTGVPMPMPGKLRPVVISHGSRSAASMRAAPFAATWPSAIWKSPSKFACMSWPVKSSADLEPAGDRAFRGERRLAAACDDRAAATAARRAPSARPHPHCRRKRTV